MFAYALSLVSAGIDMPVHGKKGPTEMNEQGQPSASDADPGASLSQTARQLRMSATTVKRWAKNGWLPSTIAADGERKFDRELPASVLPANDDGVSPEG
ncbi:MAG: hypothetical protein QOG97_281 [Acidimicrobiaceae bacterium]|jgi:hypothetical protein|nr:hypothetical protein [Acidimicrobiaceae bacterium]